MRHARKYSVITTVTSSRKITRPWMALLETSLPHVGPMKLELTLVAGMS